MTKDLDISKFIGIINPGDIYIISEQADPEWDPGPIEYIYTIRSATEIASAVEMEMEIVLADIFEFRRFQSVTKTQYESYQIMLLCFDKADRKEVSYSLYLHKLRAFEEKFCKIKRTFGVP